ncbi:hypothetical protein HY993_02215 [Candidatus Micrarchaeota archaeon]|nr:hypothetical protein [Candidatus Micrarchaeota archaeon]
MKYAALLERLESQPAFSITQLKTLFGTKKISREYLHLLVHNLLKRKKIYRITKGAYSFSDDTQVVGFAFEPFYYGLQDALSLHGLWEQETNPIVITPRRVRSGLRKFCGSNYVVRRIGRKMFFGYAMMKYGDFYIPVSDPEKTLIDFAHYGAPLDGNARKELRKKIDKKKLLEYLKKTPEKTRKKTLKLLQ